jgi:hypothetical protein
MEFPFADGPAGLRIDQASWNWRRPMRIRIERIAVSYVASTTLAVVLVHGMAALLRSLFADPGPIAALELSCAVIAVGGLSAVACWRLQLTRLIVLVGLILSAIAATLLVLLHGGLSVAALVILLAGPVQAYGVVRIAQSLLGSLDGALRRRRMTCILWCLLGLLAILQTGRIGMFLSDADKVWGASLRSIVVSTHCGGN